MLRTDQLHSRSVEGHYCYKHTNRHLINILKRMWGEHHLNFEACGSCVWQLWLSLHGTQHGDTLSNRVLETKQQQQHRAPRWSLTSCRYPPPSRGCMCSCLAQELCLTAVSACWAVLHHKKQQQQKHAKTKRLMPNQRKNGIEHQRWVSWSLVHCLYYSCYIFACDSLSILKL